MYVELLSSITTGILFGLAAGFLPGPLHTLVIVQTLKYGPREGIKVAFAPILTDIPIIIVSYFLLSRLANFELIIGLISLFGGLYVLFMAYECVQTGPVEHKGPDDNAQSIKRGVIVNFLNPHPYLFWMSVGMPLIIKLQVENPLAPILFILSLYSVLIGSKMLVAVIVGKARMFLEGKRYLYIMRFLGVMLAVFALILIKDAADLLEIFGL